MIVSGLYLFWGSVLALKLVMVPVNHDFMTTICVEDHC